MIKLVMKKMNKIFLIEKYLLLFFFNYYFDLNLYIFRF